MFLFPEFLNSIESKLYGKTKLKEKLRFESKPKFKLYGKPKFKGKLKV